MASDAVRNCELRKRLVRRNSFDVRLFYLKQSNDDSDPVLVAAKKLAGILRSKKAFTNTATFDLKCEVRSNSSLTTFWVTDCNLALYRTVGRALKEKRKHEHMQSKLGMFDSESIDINCIMLHSELIISYPNDSL
jgi:hypothetical protein